MGDEKSGEMRIFGLQENLKQGLMLVAHLARKNINLPILNNVLIRVEGGKIRLAVTNLEIGIISAIRGKIEAEGALTVNSRVISDCISLLPNQKVELRQKGNELLVSCGNYQAKIKGQTAEEFPLIPEVDRSGCFSAPVETVKNALTQVIFAAPPNEARPELSGALFAFAGQSLTLAATDSYRLAEKKIRAKSNNQEEKKIIVPTKTLQELLRILSASPADGAEEGGGELKFHFSDNQILFTYGSTELVSRLIEGQYPDYQQIIPLASKTKVIIERQELLRAVKVASLFSKTGIDDINLDFPPGKNQVVVSSASGQAGENITKLSDKVSGEGNSLVVNYRYLLEGLANMEKDLVKIEVVDGNTPCLIKPEQDENYLYIIMPIKQ
jgi:DNA polymerase-3 subunit beta